MSLRKAVKGDKPQAEQPRAPTECVAHGCPLPGVYRLSDDSSICRAHDEQPAAGWGTITNRVRNRAESFRRALLLTNEMSAKLAPRADETYFVQHHGEAFAVRSGSAFFHGTETARAYGARVFSMLLDECRQHSSVPELPPRSEEQFRRVADVIERIAP